MRRVLSLVAASAALASAAEFDDDSEVNFLRMLQGNASGNGTTLPPTTVAAGNTTLTPTTVAPTTVDAGNTTVLPTTVVAGNTTVTPTTVAPQTEETTVAPQQAGKKDTSVTVSPDQLNVEGEEFELGMGSDLEFDEAAAPSLIPKVIQATMLATMTDPLTVVRRQLGAHGNNTAGGNKTAGGNSTTDAKVTTFEASVKWDSKWTNPAVVDGVVDIAETLAPARRQLAVVKFADKFSVRVFSNDKSFMQAAKASADTQKTAMASGGSQLAALKTKLKAAIVANEAVIQKDYAGFNATLATSRIDTMTVAVTVSAVKTAKAGPKPAPSTTSGAAQVTAMSAILLAAVASLF